MASTATAASRGMIFEDDSAVREPFAAYLTDDASHAAATSIAQQRSWSTSNIRKGGLATALRLLGVAPPARFMIVDVEGIPVEEVEQGLTELARLGSQVMVLGGINDVNYFRRIMRTGARDYLVKPIDADMLGEVFVRLEQSGDGITAQGRVVGFIGSRGGVGATTLAINTAWIMSEKLSRRTALVDMDIYAGNIALSLDIEPTRGLREAFDDPERVDEVFLQNAMAKVGKGLHVLATEEAFDDTVRMSD
jgi:pilus assembly protein CpaE